MKIHWTKGITCFRLLKKSCLVLIKNYAIHIILSSRIRAPVLKLVHNECFAEQEVGLASSWVNTLTVSIHLSQSPSQSVLDWIQLTLKTHRAASGFCWLVEDHKNIISQFPTGYIMTHWLNFQRGDLFWTRHSTTHRLDRSPMFKHSQNSGNMGFNARYENHRRAVNSSVTTSWNGWILVKNI